MVKDRLRRPATGVRFAYRALMTPAMTRDASESLATSVRFIDAATFGASLQHHRAARNLSLHDVAAVTKIAERHLAALERGDVRSWPGGFYRRAMVRAYATAIGLDPEVTVCEFSQAFNEETRQVEPDPIPEPPALHGLLSVRPRASVCVGLVVCAAIATLTWATTSSDAAGAIDTNRIAPVSTVADHASVPSPTTTSEPASPQPVPPNQPPADVDASMRIMSEPAGALVTVNGIRWGQTPLTVRHLEPGEKRVRLSKDGYTSAEQRLQLTPDNPTQTVRVILAVTKP